MNGFKSFKRHWMEIVLNVMESQQIEMAIKHNILRNFATIAAASSSTAQYVSLQFILKLKYYSIDTSGQKYCLIVWKAEKCWGHLWKFILISVTQKGNCIDREYLIPQNQNPAVKLVCGILL